MDFFLGVILTIAIYSTWKTFENLDKLSDKITKLKVDKEIAETERDYYKEKYEECKEKLTLWKDWIPEDAESVKASESISTNKTPERKFDPDKVSGSFDSFFGIEKK